MTVFYTTLDWCLLFVLSVRPSSMRSSVQRTSLEARIRTIDIVTEDGMGNQAFALESVRLHGCAQLPGSFSNVLLSAPEVPPCALDSVVFIRDGWLQARSDGLPVVCCNALSVMRSAARSCVDVGSHTCHSSKTMSKSHPKQSILCEQGVVGQTADKVVSISGCVSRISLVLDAATDRPVFVVRVVDERIVESAIAFIGRKMLVWRRVLTPGQCYTFCNMLPPAPLRVSEPGHVIGPVHTYVVDESCLSFNCEDLDDITTSVPVLTQFPRPAADVSVVSEHLRVYKPQASLCHDVNPITSNGSDCVGVYFPVGSVVSLEGELTAVGTDWFELNGDERCTVWCVSGCQRDELLPFPLWLGCRVLCHDVHVLSVHTELGTLWLGFAACASTYVRLVSHGGTDKEVNLSENQPSTLPATLAEYGIIETLWARHLVASLHRSLRRTVTRTDVLGRSGSLRLFGVSVPSAHLFRRCRTGWITRSGVLSVLLRDFAWKTDRRFSRLWQFSKHSEAPCLPTDARFLFRQLVPVQCIVERSHSVYADARYDHSATGKLNHHLQRTADCQLWRLQHSTMAIGVVFSCPITGRMMFGDDTGCLPIVLRGCTPAEFQLPAVVGILSFATSSECYRGSAEWTHAPPEPIKSNITQSLFDDIKVGDQRWMLAKRRRIAASSEAFGFHKGRPDVYMDANAADVILFANVTPLRSLGSRQCTCSLELTHGVSVRVIQLMGVKADESGKFGCKVPAIRLHDAVGVTLAFEGEIASRSSSDAPSSSIADGFPCWFSMLCAGLEMKLCSCVVPAGAVLCVPAHARAVVVSRRTPEVSREADASTADGGVQSVRQALGPSARMTVSIQGVVRDKLLLSGPNKRKHGSGLHSGLREWTGIGWSIPEEHPKLVVLLRDHATLDDVKIFLDVEDGIVPVGFTIGSAAIIHNVTRKVSSNRKVYYSGSLCVDAWIEVNGVETGRTNMDTNTSGYSLVSLATLLSCPADDGRSYRVVGTLTSVSWVSLGWCCPLCDGWLVLPSEEGGLGVVSEESVGVALVCPNACDIQSSNHVWKVETSGIFDDGSAEATLYARQGFAEALLGLSSSGCSQYWKRTAWRLGRIWSSQEVPPAVKFAANQIRNDAAALLHTFEVILRRFRSGKRSEGPSKLQAEVLHICPAEPKSFCLDLLEKLRVSE